MYYSGENDLDILPHTSDKGQAIEFLRRFTVFPFLK
ncbi:HAD family hydrolase [Anabaena sp. UHCC 0253]